MIVNEIIPLADLAARYTRGILIDLSEETHGLRETRTALRNSSRLSGQLRIATAASLADGRRVACKCDRLRLSVSTEMRGRVDELLGPGHFVLLTANTASGNSGRGNGRSRG